MSTINWNNKARKQLKKIDQKSALNVIDSVETLKQFPECSNVIHLTNHKYDYRLRVGRYRVFFNFDDQIKVVSIEEIKKRDERTY